VIVWSKKMKTIPHRRPLTLKRGKVRIAGLRNGLSVLLLMLTFLAACAKEGKGIKDMVDVATSGGATVIGLKSAEVLPDDPTTLFGIVDHCQDNSIYVTQLPSLDQIMVTGSAEKGPIVEVVVVKDTWIYESMTTGEKENGTIEEIVAPGSVDEIESGSLISIWGEQRGERIVATVVKYNNHSQLILPSGPVN
jgi:hypothetical protein